MSNYRNHPGGMGGMSENITASARPVALEDILATGNRAQQRWAAKKLKKLHRLADQQARRVLTSSSPQ